MPEFHSTDLIHEKLHTQVCGEYDVIVIGGGIAGVAASLAAARQGVKTLLVEKMAVLGGLATAGQIVHFLPICDGHGRKVASGIAEELLLASIRYGAGNLPEEWLGGPSHIETNRRYQTSFNAAAFMLALDELLADAGVEILFDTVFCATAMEDRRCTAVLVENKSGRQAYRCGMVVDASGDADVLARSGALCAEQDNFLAYWAYRIDPDDPACPLKILQIGNHVGSDLPAGRRKYSGTDVRQITEFLTDSRRLALERVKTGQVTFASFASMPLFRTTRRLCGAYNLTEADIQVTFADAIGCIGDWRQAGPVYEIPYRSLYSAQIDNVFAAGRNISASGDTWEVTRVIPAAALTGQAAGTAAALAVQTGSPAGGLAISRLQQVLRDSGVILHRP